MLYAYNYTYTNIYLQSMKSKKHFHVQKFPFSIKIKVTNFLIFHLNEQIGNKKLKNNPLHWIQNFVTVVYFLKCASP